MRLLFSTLALFILTICCTPESIPEPLTIEGDHNLHSSLFISGTSLKISNEMISENQIAIRLDNQVIGTMIMGKEYITLTSSGIINQLVDGKYWIASQSDLHLELVKLDSKSNIWYYFERK